MAFESVAVIATLVGGLITNLTGVGALIWTIRSTARRETHERQMKESESRLRLATDLEARIHDRSWELLREVLRAGRDCEEAVMQYATAVGIRDNNPHTKVDTEAARLVASAKLSEFECIVRTTPPEFDLGPIHNAFRTIVVRTLAAEHKDVILKPGERFPDRPSVIDQVRAANLSFAEVLARWNSHLWRRSDAILALASSGTPLAELPHADK